MGLGAPEIVLLLIAFLFVGSAVIFPIWGYKAGAKRAIGAVPGLLLGLFLNIIGIIIIYCTPVIETGNLYPFQAQSSADELQKFKQLLDSGAISEVEYNNQKARILSAGRKF